MNKLIFLCLTLVQLVQLQALEIKLNLLDFANLASSNSNVDILLSDDINANDYYFYTNKETPISIGHFRKAIEVKNLRLILTDKFYYVDKKFADNNSSKILPKKLRYIELKNNSFDDVNNLINIHTDSNTTYIKTSNAVVFNGDDEEYSSILENVEKIDKRLEQVMFKLTITETNLKDAKSVGTHLNSLFKTVTSADLKYFINLITMPYTSETNVIKDKKEGFYGVLSLLEENGISFIKSSPFLTAQNGSEVYFSSVENIPYLVQNNQIQDSRNFSQNSYQYKDVGLKIKITPIILKDYVNFTLELIIEDILDDSTLTPRTSKKELKSSYSLKRGDILVLSGINKDVEYTKRNGVPVLKEIPIIKYLFSVEQDYKISNVITLTIEVN